MSDIQILALAKGCEKYVFFYHDTSLDRSSLVSAIGRQASDPDLSLTWYDAAMLCAKLRETSNTKPLRRT